MPLYELAADRLRTVPSTSFAAEGVRERQDLQRLLRRQIEVVAPDVMVLAEEFGDWDGSRRRIDLLGLDRDARLVVFELKRSADGGHMELQALRYAAMVARLSFEQAVEAHRRWLAELGEEGDPERAILDFLGWSEPDPAAFAQDVRIVLVAADFSKELATTVLWLNERDLDVRCVRLRPHELDGRVVLDVQQVLPLPEAADHLVQVRERARDERRWREARRDGTRYDVTVGGDTYTERTKRAACLLVVRALCAAGVSPGTIDAESPAKGRLWRSTDGSVDAATFAARMRAEADAGGAAWSPSRWFCADGELVHADGRTWALTNQWGASTDAFLARLLERWPDHGVDAVAKAA